MRVKAVYSTQELLDVATRKDLTPETPFIKSPPEHFRNDIFNELFLEIKFFLNQKLNLEKIIKYTGKDNSLNIKMRLERLLETFEKRLYKTHEFQEGLQIKLNDSEPDVLNTAAYICTSIDVQNPDSKYLNQIFSKLIKAERSPTTPLITALKYGTHHHINTKLKFTADISDADIAICCQHILEFRHRHLL